MSVFDTYSDSPFKIKEEGQEIVVVASRTSPTTLRISWTLSQVTQCGQGAAYNGAIVTIDTTPITLSKVPVDGTEYTGDPTASPQLNAGDRLGTALVVGAFYNDTTTFTLDVTDAPQDTPYYVSLHAVDKEFRYHTDGVFSYSLPFGNGNTDLPTAGFQEIRLGSSGIQLTTPLNLVPATTYSFKVIADCHRPGYTFSFQGSQITTYGSLIDLLNAQVISTLTPTTTSDNSFPGKGYYWYNSGTKVINLWDQFKDVAQSAIMLGENPLQPTLGKLWYNTANNNLWQFTAGTPNAYVAAPYFSLSHDPRQPYCDDYWYSATSGLIYRWTGMIWEQKQMFTTTVDPQLASTLPCFAYWFDGTNLYERDDQLCIWDKVPFIASSTDFAHPASGAYWVNSTTLQLSTYTNSAWVATTSVNTKPSSALNGLIFVDPVTFAVQVYDNTNGWVSAASIALPTDPTIVAPGTIWKQGPLFFIWDTVDSLWTQLPVTTSATDPTLPPVLAQGVIWHDNVAGTLAKLEGTSWVDVTGVTAVTDVKPQILTSFIWYNPQLNVFNQLANGMLSSVTPISATFDPAAIADGQLWYAQNTSVLSQWGNGQWNVITVNQTPFTLTLGQFFYNNATKTLYQWNGATWVVAQPGITFSFNTLGNGYGYGYNNACGNDYGHIVLTSSTLGSTSEVAIVDYPNIGNFWNSFTLGIPMEVHRPQKGTDPVSKVPTYMELGVGTDGSQDERRNLIEKIKNMLGYPVFEVELTKAQMDTAVDNALAELRLRTGNGYKRAVFFMEVRPHEQRYILSDRTVGFNKIVDVMYLHRMTSAYLGTGIGAGIYGQIAIQQMYTMGKFDLVSYHLVAGYIELMKQMFATELQFGWDEYTRELSIFKEFYVHERVLVDAVIEKTEQEIITDRWSARWIQKFATAQARLMLAEIRGKYGSIIAAGGSVTMNAGDLRQTAEREMQECYDDIENYVVNNKEVYGASSDFIIG